MADQLSKSAEKKFMSDKRCSIEIHIVMYEDGHFVVDADVDAAADKANDEFPDDDLRQITLIIEAQPPSSKPEAIVATVRVD